MALRAVRPGEKSVPLSVEGAAAVGDALAMQRAALLRIARAIDDDKTPARDLAALTKRLQDTQHEIEALTARSEEDHGPVESSDEKWEAV